MERSKKSMHRGVPCLASSCRRCTTNIVTNERRDLKPRRSSGRMTSLSVVLAVTKTARDDRRETFAGVRQ